MFEQSLGWLIPYSLLMLVMLHAMMEFTVSLLAQRPRSQRKPASAAELREHLLALNEPDQPYQLVEGLDCDLEIYWEVGQAPPRGRFALAKGATVGRLRCLLDESRHELRLNQVDRSFYFFLGMSGWLPRVRGYFSFQAGPPGHAMTAEISHVANRRGWTVRPVLWWFQATYQGYHLVERLTPAPLRRWSARRFWGIVYPVSYVLGIGYLAAVIGPLDWHNLALILGISAAWWGIWGLLVWMLCGFPAFWRRRRG
jgi:hypothetical protein